MPNKVILLRDPSAVWPLICPSFRSPRHRDAINMRGSLGSAISISPNRPSLLTGRCYQGSWAPCSSSPDLSAIHTYEVVYFVGASEHTTSHMHPLTFLFLGRCTFPDMDKTLVTEPDRPADMTVQLFSWKTPEKTQ